MSNLYKRSSIDASYQVSVHLVKRFQRRFFRNRPIRKTKITYCGHVCKRINPKLTIDIEDLPYMLSTKFQFIWPSDFRGEYFFRNRPIRNNNCLWWPCFLMNRAKISNIYKGPFIYASYQVSVHLAKRLQRRIFFRTQPIRNKNCLWWPCLLTDHDEMSNRNKGLFIDASYQVSVHLAKRFHRRRI